jgi:pilus assembly protein CpaB
MNTKTLVSFAAAIAFGLVAVVLVRSVLVRNANAEADKTLRPVVVAATQIDRGVATQGFLLKVARFPADGVPTGAFASLTELTGPNSRIALRAFAANEPILESKLAAVGSAPVMSMNLKPGMRAISVKSDEVVGVGGFVVPGDKVDVLVTRQLEQSGNAPTVVQALAEDVLVLGVDQIDDTDKPTVAKAVTLEVTADQAQSISLAKAVGVITLALRQTADDSKLSRKTLSAGDLGGAATHPAVARPARSAAPAAPSGLKVLVTRGTATSSQDIARDYTEVQGMSQTQQAGAKLANATADAEAAIARKLTP